MNEVVIGVLLSALCGWVGWTSLTILNILRKIDMILYKAEDYERKMNQFNQGRKNV